MLTKIQMLRYLIEVALQLPGSWKQKKLVLEEIKRSIQSYAFEGDYISYGQIRSRFGDPKQVAAAYLSELAPEELLENVNVKKKVVRILLTAAITAVVVWAIFLILCFISVQKDANGYTVVEVIEISRSE